MGNPALPASGDDEVEYYRKDLDEVLKILGSSKEGLPSGEARDRLMKYGQNRLKELRKRTLFMMFLDQFRDFMIIVLLAAALVSGMIGDLVDTLAILVIVILNAVVGFVQEFRAEKAMEALKKMASPSAVTVRDSRIVSIPAAELVPGDVVLLEAGRIVPADIRLIESARLLVDEAALTGESTPVAKENVIIGEEAVPLGDRVNMVFSGTAVTYGRGRGVVARTGMETELGRIAAMLQKEEGVKTPLQKRLAKFGERLAIAVLAICAIVFVTGLIRGEAPVLMFLTAVSLAVAAIPEALPAVVTISLAIGAKKLVRQNALIRKLPAVETLGSVTYICSDKTGTLTMNRMSLEELYVHDELIAGPALKKMLKENRGDIKDKPSLETLFRAMVLCNDATPGKGGEVIGDPTEVALFEAAERAGFIRTKLEIDYPRSEEIPFDSERKCMTTFHEVREDASALERGKKEVLSRRVAGNETFRYMAFTKGAIETVLEGSTGMLAGDTIVSLDDDRRNRIMAVNRRMADDGLRTLAIAVRLWDALPAEVTPDSAERGLTLVGLVGLMDPPREEAAEAVALCKSAGIKPVMITGDHPLTARTIAKRLGIIEDDDVVMSGRELERLPLDEFEKQVERVKVYARVAPEQKIKIVRALQDRGEFSAMTGDGVNDAPALKRADIGVAMGITGTDVAKEASHMILLDDNFATIVRAVREGRRIFDNIRKFIKYTMTSNSGEIWTIFLAPFLGLPIPLLPVHILWINLVTDGLPGLALAVEPGEKGIMKRPPRHPRESIFAHGMAAHIIWVGLLMGGMSIFTEAWSITTGHAHWQTMVFTVLCLSQMGHVLAIRSERESLFSLGLFSNKPLIGAVLITFLLQMATIYVPFLNPVFKTSPLTPSELLLTLLLSSIVFFAVEIEKWWFRSRERREHSVVAQSS
jgi:Ca2+-transporting ATPase